MKKKFIAFTIAALASIAAMAKDYSDLTIYINPGHGGHDAANDRNVVIYPYAEGDTSGFWESNSNMHKGFFLRDMLQDLGVKVVMSRVTNTSADDLGLETIGRLANAAGSDLFLSIHSNATGTSNRVNFPIIFFRGYDNEPVYPDAKVWATDIDVNLLTNGATIWTSTNTNVRGDWSFQPTWGTQGYGVLRKLTIPGALSEGSFHDYIPETYRLMSLDYKWIEAWNFRKAVDDHYSLPGVSYGAIAGRLNDSRFPRVGDFKMIGDDQLETVDTAYVSLWDETGTTKLQETYSDMILNGIYAFRKVEPGKYMMKVSGNRHYETSTMVEVTADEITYVNLKLSKIRNTAPVVETHSPVWKEGDPGVLCNTPVVLDFNWDMDTASVEAAFSITPEIPGEITWENNNLRMIFTPTQTYQTSTVYTARLDASAKHAGGMAMEAPFELSFFTADRNYMSIIGQFPKDGEKVHFDNPAIEVRFDKLPNVTPILKQISIVDSTGTKVALNNRKMTYSKLGAEYGFFRIPFTKDLTVGNTYKMTLSNEIADKDGIPLQDSVVVHFTAVDAGTEKPDSIIEDMEDATLYALNSQGSVDVDTVSIKKDATNKLFGTSCVNVMYEFPATEGSEMLLSRSALADAKLTNNDAVGVHVYGDLTANEVYLEVIAPEDVKYIPIGKLDFLGWRYFEVPLTMLEGEKEYQLSGVKMVQTPSLMSRKGEFKLDNISYIKDGAVGVEGIETMTSVTVYPNPASEYLIANADGLIDKVELIGMNGSTIATADGNVLNVSEIADGVYFIRIFVGGTSELKKVVVKH